MCLELRWIFEGHIPKSVEQWFYDSTTLGYAKKVQDQNYEDIYLFAPEVDYLSVKFREKKLDIKWRRSDFPFTINTGRSRSKNISGIIEDWMEWEQKERNAVFENIDEYMKKGKGHPWIKILKERSRYKQKYKNGYLKQIINKDNEDEADCSIELVSLKLEANKNMIWWSLGIDMFKDMNATKKGIDELKELIYNLVSNCPISLNSSHSYCYPKLFSLKKNSLNKYRI